MLKRKRVLLIALAIVVSVVLAGAFFYGYSSAKPIEKPRSAVQTNPLQEIKELEKKVKDNPQKADLEKLANDYFDYAYTLRESNVLDQSKQYFARAAQLYQQVVDIDPKQVAVWTDMGTALYYSDQKDQAEAIYQKAIQVDPKYANARLNYGTFLLYERNDQDAARQQMTAALQINPSLGDTVRSLLAGAPGGQAPDYTRDIEPFIFQNCTRCHGPGGVIAKAPLHTYNAVAKYVSPLDPQSPLLVKMKQGHPEKYTLDNLGLIERWIMVGAPGPRPH